MWLQPSGAVPLLSDLHRALVLRGVRCDSIDRLFEKESESVWPHPDAQNKTHHHLLRADDGVAARGERYLVIRHGRFAHSNAGPDGFETRSLPAGCASHGRCSVSGLGVVPLLFSNERLPGVQALPVQGCGGGMRFRRCSSGWRLLHVGALSSAGSRPRAGTVARDRQQVSGRAWQAGGCPEGSQEAQPSTHHCGAILFYIRMSSPHSLRYDLLGRTSCDRLQHHLRAFLIGPARRGIRGLAWPAYFHYRDFGREDRRPRAKTAAAQATANFDGLAQ